MGLPCIAWSNPMSRTDVHPVELLLAIALEVVAAVITLMALAAAARPMPTPAPEPLPPAPSPLEVIATAAQQALEPLPVAQLRRLARSAGLPRALSRTGRRAELVAALVGLEVALI